MAAISDWIDLNDSVEKDFIILGDMNFYSKDELDLLIPAGFLSLNDECRFTTTNQPVAEKGKPYDHVMYDTTYTRHEIDEPFDLLIVNLIAVMEPYWHATAPYPGDPYDHNQFRQYYSDHHPVVFRMIASADDDAPIM